MRAFVTGGSGFLGRALIQRLVRDQVPVVAIGRSEAARQTITGLGATSCDGDVSDEAKLRTGMQNCDVVFHCAGFVDTWGEYKDAYAINVDGTKNVLRAAEAAGVRRFVHVSNEAAVADGNPLVNADESAPIPPQNKLAGVYSKTKALAEQEVIAANGTLETIVVRPRFIWGKGDLKVLPRMIEMMHNGRWSWINQGKYLTSTVNINNCVEGMILAAEKGKHGEVYYLTDGEPIEFRKFVEDMSAAWGEKVPDKNVPGWLVWPLASTITGLWGLFGAKNPPPLNYQDLALMAHEMTVSDAKARRDFGYKNVMSIEEGIAEMREEHQQQQQQQSAKSEGGGHM